MKNINNLRLTDFLFFFFINLTIFAKVSESSVSSTQKTEQSLDEMVRETCLQKSGFRPLDNNSTLFRVVEVPESTSVYLPCSFCGESTEDLPRVWSRRIRKVNSSVEEVDLDLGPNLYENRVVTFPNHSLVIHNITLNDTGMYFCKNPQEETAEFQFNVDIVVPDVPVALEKDKPWTTFEKYEKGAILEANEKIYLSKNNVLNDIFDKVKIKVVSEWDPWLPCDGCSGLRRRYAKCRIHAWMNRVKYPDIVDDNLNEVQRLMHQSNIVSCHSKDLSKWLPPLYYFTKSIPNYLQVQKCFDSCTLANQKGHAPKYQMDIRLDVGTSMSFVCPESTLKSKVIWKRDGVTMKPVGMKKKKEKKKKVPLYKKTFQKHTEEFSLERAFVDRMNVLQLCSVTYKESGLFACYVNSDIMKSFNVSVVTAEETQRERFYHFLLLSIYTSLVSTVIVFVGIGWGYLNRNKFLKIDSS